MGKFLSVLLVIACTVVFVSCQKKVENTNFSNLEKDVQNYLLDLYPNRDVKKIVDGLEKDDLQSLVYAVNTKLHLAEELQELVDDIDKKTPIKVEFIRD